MELNRSYPQLEKELIAECLDVANTGREVDPLERMMIFLVIIQASVQGLSLRTWVTRNCLGWGEIRDVVHSPLVVASPGA